MLTIAGDQKADSVQGAKPETATGKRNGNERLPSAGKKRELIKRLLDEDADPFHCDDERNWTGW